MEKSCSLWEKNSYSSETIRNDFEKIEERKKEVIENLESQKT